MSDERDSIEHELIRTGTLVEVKIIDTQIEPTAAGDDSHVQIKLKIPEDDVESFKTTIEAAPDGFATIQTINRGEAVVRWVDKLKGKKTLQQVE